VRAAPRPGGKERHNGVRIAAVTSWVSVLSPQLVRQLAYPANPASRRALGSTIDDARPAVTVHFGCVKRRDLTIEGRPAADVGVQFGWAPGGVSRLMMPDRPLPDDMIYPFQPLSSYGTWWDHRETLAFSQGCPPPVPALRRDDAPYRRWAPMHADLIEPVWRNLVDDLNPEPAHRWLDRVPECRPKHSDRRKAIWLGRTRIVALNLAQIRQTIS
jgi:hypothetical protein